MLVISALANAHHSISRHYQRNNEITIEGAVVDVLLRNPHSQIRIEVTDASGEPQLWTLELDEVEDMADQGIVAGTLRQDDVIIVFGYPARDGSNAMFVEELRRPSDGLYYEDD